MAQTQDREPCWHERVFFGLHFDLHARAEDTELGAETTEAHLRAELGKVRPDWVMYDCKGVPGYTGFPSRVGLPSPGIVRDALPIWRKVTSDLGVPLSVHVCGLWDDASWQRHPEWGAVKPAGTRYGEDRFDGWTAHPLGVDSPYLEELLLPLLLEVIDRYDVDGLWLDADAWVTVADWGERTRRLYLQESGAGAVPRDPSEPGWADYLAFNRRRYTAYLTRLCDELHARKPSFAVCSNWAYSARMPEEVAAPVDYLSGDYTWKFAADSISCEAKFMDGRGLPWDLMGWAFTTAGAMTEQSWTLRSVEELCMEGALVMANGGAFWIYDNPLRCGRLVDWHMDSFAKVGRFLRRRKSVFQGTVSAPHVAVLHSRSHFYAQAALQTPGPLHRADAAMATLTGALQLALRNHYHADVLTEDVFLRRLVSYRVAIVAEQVGLPDALRHALVSWVEAGGRLLLTGAHAVAEWGDVIGARAAGEPIQDTLYVPADPGLVPIRGPWQPVEAAGARVLAPLHRTPELARGRLPFPAATLVKRGSGWIAAIHGPVAAMYGGCRYAGIRDFAGRVLRALTGPMPVEIDAPPHVEMTVREKRGRLIVHLVNTASANPLSPVSPCIESIAPTGPVELRVACPRRPQRVSTVPATDGLRSRWSGGIGRVTLPSLHIHTAVVIERGGAP